MSHEELLQALTAQQPVTTHEMNASGFSPSVLAAASALGLPWTALVALFLKYGPQLLQILLDLMAHQVKK